MSMKLPFLSSEKRLRNSETCWKSVLLRQCPQNWSTITRNFSRRWLSMLSSTWIRMSSTNDWSEWRRSPEVECKIRCLLTESPSRRPLLMLDLSSSQRASRIPSSCPLMSSLSSRLKRITLRSESRKFRYELLYLIVLGIPSDRGCWMANHL